jgi:hypothetical protein
MSSVILTPSQPQYSSGGPWSANAGAWAASSLTYGVDYTQSITFDNTAFPNGTLISWSFPLYGGPFGVWSYPCIIYGSTPELANTSVPSLQVANLTNLSVSYSTALTVNSGQLDTIFDIWLTSTPYGGMSTATYELEIIPQTVWHYGGYAYTFSDSTLQNANVYVNADWGGNPWTNIVVEPSTEMLTGTISISDILKNLIWNGVITGQEYISGVEFGPEPGSGAGSLLINSMSYQWAGSSTVHLAVGNNVLQIGIPGGNDVVGNGATDTVVYNAPFSQFQIKTSGSETLVVENNNISTLDYLRGIAFIQFSNGIFSTVNSTFALTLPTLSVCSGMSALASEQIALSSLVTVSNPSNASYQLQLWDSHGTATGGEFLVNGVAQKANSAISVPAGANVVFDTGTGAGTDTLWARVVGSNGSTSSWEEFSVTVPAPTLTVQNDPNATPNEQIPLSTLVSVTDPSNASYQLQLWDSNGTAASGEFLINGVAQSANHAIDVPAGADVVFESASTGESDTLWARLIQANGTSSTWQEFVVTDPVDVAPNSTFEVASDFVAPVTFEGPNGTLQLDDSRAFTGTVAGFGATDQIDLRDISFVSQMTLGYASNSTGTGGTLTISDGSHRAALALLGQYAATSFVAVSDGHGGVAIEMPTQQSATLAPPQHI